MTRKDLAAIVSARTGLSALDADLVLGEAIVAIKEALLRGETITFRAFGAFERRLYSGRKFELNGHTYRKPDRYIPAFIPHPSFRASACRLGVEPTA